MTLTLKTFFSNIKFKSVCIIYKTNVVFDLTSNGLFFVETVNNTHLGRETVNSVLHEMQRNTFPAKILYAGPMCILFRLQ